MLKMILIKIYKNTKTNISRIPSSEQRLNFRLDCLLIAQIFFHDAIVENFVETDSVFRIFIKHRFYQRNHFVRYVCPSWEINWVAYLNINKSYDFSHIGLVPNGKRNSPICKFVCNDS